MVLYLGGYRRMTIDQGFEVNSGKAEAKPSSDSAKILLDVIPQLSATRLLASQLGDDILLYAIDVALSQANGALNEQRRLRVN
jgi:hypothetical protein